MPTSTVANGDGNPHAEVIGEADVSFRPSPFDDDDVCHGACDREVPGECADQREQQPKLAGIAKLRSKVLKQHNCRDIAY